MKKKILIAVLVVIVVGVGILAYSNKKTMEERDLYTNADHIMYSEVLSQNDHYIVYYYQASCGHCQEIKIHVESFYHQVVVPNDELSFYLVDMGANENVSAWYDWEYHDENYDEGVIDSNPNYTTDVSEMEEVSDIPITGTPLMIEVKDGEVITYAFGSYEIQYLLEKVALEYGVEL